MLSAAKQKKRNKKVVVIFLACVIPALFCIFCFDNSMTHEINRINEFYAKENTESVVLGIKDRYDSAVNRLNYICEKTIDSLIEAQLGGKIFGVKEQKIVDIIGSTLTSSVLNNKLCDDGIVLVSEKIIFKITHRNISDTEVAYEIKELADDYDLEKGSFITWNDFNWYVVAHDDCTVLLKLKNDWEKLIFDTDNVELNADGMYSLSNNVCFDYHTETCEAFQEGRHQLEIAAYVCCATAIILALFVVAVKKISYYRILIALVLPVFMFTVSTYASVSGIGKKASMFYSEKMLVSKANDLTEYYTRVVDLANDIFSDKNIQEWMYHNIDDENFILVKDRLNDYISAKDLFISVKMYTSEGELVYENMNYAAPKAQINFDDRQKMINTMFRGIPTFSHTDGNMDWLTYTIKLYSIPAFDSVGYLEISVPMNSLSEVLDKSKSVTIGSMGLFIGNRKIAGQSLSDNDCNDFEFQIGDTSIALKGMCDTSPIQNEISKNTYTLVLATLIYALASAMILFLISEISRLRIKVAYEVNESIKRNLEMETLQAQITPHFLLNTMQTISFLIDDRNITQASRMLKLLNYMFKYGISRSDSYIPIAEEVKYSMAYIEIMNIRYGNRISSQFYVQPGTDNHIILKMVMQPLIENSIKHALKGERNLLINIRVTQESEMIILTVEDNGKGIPKEKLEEIRMYMKEGKASKGIGIVNVDRRIRLCYGEMYGLDIVSEEDKGTRIHVKIPTRSQS